MTRLMLLLACLYCIAGELSANIVSCDNRSSVSVNSIICNNNNTLDGNDDFLSFNLNGINAEGVKIVNLPARTIVTDQEQLSLNFSNALSNIEIEDDGKYAIKVPSKSCQPLSLIVQWDESGCQNSLLIVDSRAEIPTIGQWGVLIIFISIMIIGYLEIRKTKNRTIYLRTSIPY